MKIVFSASITDCLHQGHKNLLEQMRKEGDKVIMVIHDDLSCYHIKGKMPIQTTKHRKKNLLLTKLVDKVMITHNVDPYREFERIIRKYSSKKNELLFMRGDDNLNFPGKQIISKYNIPIKFIPYTKGISSTQIRNEI